MLRALRLARCCFWVGCAEWGGRAIDNGRRSLRLLNGRRSPEGSLNGIRTPIGVLNGIAGKFFVIKCHSLPFSDQRERMPLNAIKVGCAEWGRLSGGN